MIQRPSRMVCAVLFTALAACSGGVPAAGPGAGPTPATRHPPSAPAIGALRYSPGVTRYVIAQSHHVDQTLPTGNQVQEIGLKTFVTAVITGPADARGYGLSLTVDSILSDSGTMLPPAVDLQAARGLRYDAHLAPNGRLVDPRPSDPDVAKNLAQLLGGFRTFYPRLPGAGLAPGAVWSDSSDVTDTTGAAVVVDRAATRYAAGDWENTDGVRQLGIQVTEDFTVSGSGQAGGATFALSGTGLRTGRLAFSAAGRFLGGSTTDSAGIVITFDPQGMTVPRHQVSHTTITVIP